MRKTTRRRGGILPDGAERLGPRARERACDTVPVKRTIEIDGELLAAAKRRAEAEGVSVDAFVEEALRARVAEEGEGQPLTSQAVARASFWDEQFREIQAEPRLEPEAEPPPGLSAELYEEHLQHKEREAERSMREWEARHPRN